MFFKKNIFERNVINLQHMPKENMKVFDKLQHNFVMPSMSFRTNTKYHHLVANQALSGHSAACEDNEYN